MKTAFIITASAAAAALCGAALYYVSIFRGIQSIDWEDASF